MITGQENFNTYITQYYKGLFGHPEATSISLDFTEASKISEYDYILLTQVFTMEELKEAVLGMATNKAAGPDGFNADFYQKNWDLVKDDLFRLLMDFHKETWTWLD